MSADNVQVTASAEMGGATIRAQLLWASLFPLAFFGLLSMLVTFTAFNRIALDLTVQRNTAQVQLLAISLAPESLPASDVLSELLESIAPVSGSRLYLVDALGNPVAGSEANLDGVPLRADELRLFIGENPASRLLPSTADREDVLVSYAPLPGGAWGLVLMEPWAANMLPAFSYQLILVALLVLGTVLSLGMLSVGIGRIIRPIALLAENARSAVPGSVFHPLSLHGPLEIRLLINAFNQMVIRLAEQQTILRQYAHKALLSQEEERQRLSHELHDGTLQDLLSLAQRVELCRNELGRDPSQARHRLDELHGLLEQTLENVRRISHALRPPVLEDLGLSIALEALCKDLKRDKPELQCAYSVSGLARRLQPDLELAVYRVVQEALTNIRKHAPTARRVQVELSFGEAEIQAIVKNDGAVFTNQDVRSYVSSGHLGLAGMYERARLFGGKLEMTSNAGEDTIVALWLPCS